MKILRDSQGRVYYDPTISIDEQIKAIARISNRQLTLLEKLAKQPGYKGVLSENTAYAIAQYDIQRLNVSVGSNKKNRFMNKIDSQEYIDAVLKDKTIDKKTKEQYINNREAFLDNAKQRLLQSLIRFQNSATYSKERIDAMYVKRVNSINERYGTKFSWLDYNKFLENDYMAKLKTMLSSDQALRIFGKIQKNGAQLVEEVWGSLEKFGVAPINKKGKLSDDDIMKIMESVGKAKLSISKIERKEKELKLQALNKRKKKK